MCTWRDTKNELVCYLGMEQIMAKWVLNLEGDYTMDDISMDEYQQEALLTAIYPKDRGLEYLALKLCGEAGEVAEKIGKSIRDNKPLDDRDMAKELGDVLWYVANLAQYLGYDLSEIAEMNLTKLKDRQARGVLGGSGDNR
jgi:NTP pyrophosphatase (non-canonical NTP hydrolase)